MDGSRSVRYGFGEQEKIVKFQSHCAATFPAAWPHMPVMDKKGGELRATL
jgi:hypothetical protein